MNKLIVKELCVKEDTVLNIEIEDGSYSYEVKVNDNINLTINRVGKVNNYEEKLKLIVGSNTKVFLNDGVLVNNNFKSVIDTIIEGNNNTIRLCGGYVSKNNGNIDIVSNGVVREKTINNDFYEHADILVTGTGKVKVLPNLLVGTNETVSNHGVTISGYDEAMLTYLETKGISIEASKNLIEQSYLNKFIK